MKNRMTGCLVILLVTVCLFLHSCSGDNSKVAAIFDGLVVEMSANPPSEGAMIGAAGLVTATEIMGTERIPASDFIVIETNPTPTIRDAIQLDANMNCMFVERMREKCFVRWESIEANSDIEFSEWGQRMGKGHATTNSFPSKSVASRIKLVLIYPWISITSQRT